MSIQLNPTQSASIYSSLPHSANSLGPNLPLDGSTSNQALGAEFESVFFSLLIKNMRTSMTQDGLFGSESSDTYGGLFDLYMGKHLAKSRSLGISQFLESNYLEKQSDGKQSTSTFL